MTAPLCRNCGVELRHSWFGGWRHVMQLGPVRCDKPEPEPPAEPAEPPD